MVILGQLKLIIPFVQQVISQNNGVQILVDEETDSEQFPKREGQYHCAAIVLPFKLEETIHLLEIAQYQGIRKYGDCKQNIHLEVYHSNGHFEVQVLFE